MKIILIFDTQCEFEVKLLTFLESGVKILAPDWTNLGSIGEQFKIRW